MIFFFFYVTLYFALQTVNSILKFLLYFSLTDIIMLPVTFERKKMKEKEK